MQRIVSVISLAAVLTIPLAAPAGDAPVSSHARTARTIFLIRHGQYAPDATDSSPGPGLTPLGVAQAKLVAARLAGMPGTFDAIHVSPMTRAMETAKVIAAELPQVPLSVAPELKECTPRTRRKEITKDEKPQDLAACASTLDAVFKRRFVPAEGVERREIFVCHGNVTRYLVTKSLGVDTEAWLEMSLGHASITQIRVEPDGRFKVISVGDIGHIPPNLQSGASGMTEKELVAPK